MSVQYPLINGVRHDWSSIEFAVQLPNGAPIVIVGVKSINYKFEKKGTLVYGTGPKPVGITRGVFTPDGDVEMYLDEFSLLVAQLGPGFADVPVTARVSYSEGERTYTDTLIGARIAGVEASQSQGADPLTRKLPLTMLDILYNGASAVNQSLALASTQGPSFTATIVGGVTVGI
jgi:hypothetical protein